MKKLFLTIAMICLALTGCATANMRNPVANMPAVYQQGYFSGCDSGYVAAGHPYYRFSKDPFKYSSDNLYKQGWDDGFAVCKGSYDQTMNMLR